jgi:hypothetical protein
VQFCTAREEVRTVKEQLKTAKEEVRTANAKTVKLQAGRLQLSMDILSNDSNFKLLKFYTGHVLCMMILFL